MTHWLTDGQTFGKCRLAPLLKMILKDINWWKITNIGYENKKISWTSNDSVPPTLLEFFPAMISKWKEIIKRQVQENHNHRISESVSECHIEPIDIKDPSRPKNILPQMMYLL